MNKYKIIDQDNSFAGNIAEYYQTAKQAAEEQKEYLQGR